MQGQQLTDALRELTEAVNQAMARADKHTPDEVVAPVVQAMSQLAAQLKSKFPQA